jgi:hypothetical protein
VKFLETVSGWKWGIYFSTADIGTPATGTSRPAARMGVKTVATICQRLSVPKLCQWKLCPNLGLAV